MIEVSHDLDAYDGKKIFCTYSSNSEKPWPRAVILSHGLTGNPNEYIHLMARNYFLAHGYDVYRFAYYKSGSQYRLLHESTLEIHGRDLNNVIAFVQSRHEQVFVCGHSYGGLTMLFANPEADAISFWDSAFDPWNEFWKDEKRDFPALDCHGLAWGSMHLIGKAMVQEARNLDANQVLAMAEALVAPAQIIIAENGDHQNSRRIYEAYKGQKELMEISHADHCFTTGNTIDELLLRTENWFARF